MLEKAINKLQSEISENTLDDYIVGVANHMIDYVKKNPTAAPFIIAEDKNVKGSLKAMREIAAKKKSGNMAVITPEQGFKIIMEYYGITDSFATPKRVDKQNDDFNLSLDDLL